MQNAIRHNIKGGKILITLSQDALSIANTGKLVPLQNKDLYQRFSKNSEIHDSIGFGLAIAKEIAEANDLILSYAYDAGWHTFTIQSK